MASRSIAKGLSDVNTHRYTKVPRGLNHKGKIVAQSPITLGDGTGMGAAEVAY